MVLSVVHSFAVKMTASGRPAGLPPLISILSACSSLKAVMSTRRVGGYGIGVVAVCERVPYAVGFWIGVVTVWVSNLHLTPLLPVLQHCSVERPESGVPQKWAVAPMGAIQCCRPEALWANTYGTVADVRI